MNSVSLLLIRPYFSVHIDLERYNFYRLFSRHKFIDR